MKISKQYYTKIVFGIDPKLFNRIQFKLSFHENEKIKEYCVSFLTDDRSVISRQYYVRNEICFLEIPHNAKIFTITSNSKMKAFGTSKLNPAITSIEHFESNCLTALTNAFYGFINVREFKHFNVTSKVTEARSMCSGWKKFNGTLPESFCSIFEFLKEALCMFANWHSFNKQLPEGFFSDTKNLQTSSHMFYNWHSFNKQLPEGFFSDTKNLLTSSYMFYNWHSFNKQLPEGFFSDTKNLQTSSYMFYNWHSYKHELPQYLVDKFNYLKKTNTSVCIGWHKNNQIQNSFNYGDISVKDYKDEDIVYLKKYYFDKIQNLILMSKLKNDTKIYRIKDGDLSFVVHNGIFMFPLDILSENKKRIKEINKKFGIIIGYNDICVELCDIDAKSMTLI